MYRRLNTTIPIRIQTLRSEIDDSLPIGLFFMPSSASVVLILLVTVAVSILLRRWLRAQAFKQAGGVARQVFPVWAAQGPFESGAMSAAAMRHAYLAVMGPDEAERMAEGIAKHAAAYDSNPAAWEENRQRAAQAVGTDTAKFVTIAEGLAAMDSLNKDLLEAGGHKLELARQPDGSLGIEYKKIWSDDAIEEKRKQDDEAFVSGIGNGLLSASSEEARALVAFLTEVYEANTGEKAESAYAIGRAWLACFAVKNEKPESDLAQRFEELNEAHQAIIASRQTKTALPHRVQ
jgi:hypothetical protein